MPEQTGELDHQLATDLTDHALYVGIIAFAIILGIVLTLLAVDDARRRRRDRADRAAAEVATRLNRYPGRR